MIKNNFKKILYSLLLVLSMSACTGADKGEKKSIDVPRNQGNFSISLHGNPTTGYQWRVLDFDKSLLSLSGSEYQASKTNLIGSGGIMVFHFELLKDKQYPKETRIRFEYARPWESHDENRIEDVTVHFVTPSE